MPTNSTKTPLFFLKLTFPVLNSSLYVKQRRSETYYFLFLPNLPIPSTLLSLWNREFSVTAYVSPSCGAESSCYSQWTLSRVLKTLRQPCFTHCTMPSDLPIVPVPRSVYKLTRRPLKTEKKPGTIRLLDALEIVQTDSAMNDRCSRSTSTDCELQKNHRGNAELR